MGTTRSTADEYLRDAKEAFREGAVLEALQLLLPAFAVDSEYKALYKLAAECLQELGDPEGAALYSDAYNYPRNAATFCALGRLHLSRSEPEVAVPFLQRAVEMQPDDMHVGMDLSIALAESFQVDDACKVLLDFPYDTDIHAEFYYYWFSLLNGRTAGITDFIRRAREAAESRGYGSQSARDLLPNIDNLEEALARFETVPSPDRLIGVWQYIQHGSVILLPDDESRDEDGELVAGGRWVYLNPPLAMIAQTLRRLKRYLTEMNRYPTSVLGLWDRDSEVIARAVALVLDVPCRQATARNVVREDCLIVAARSSYFHYPLLEQVQPGQTLFALDCDWLHPSTYTPDIVGFMTQQCFLPWSDEKAEFEELVEQTLGDEFEIETEEEPGEAESDDTEELWPDEIARNIAAEPEVDDPAFEATLGFYKQRADYLKGGKLGGRKRLPFRTESPVPGRYFIFGLA